MKFFERLVFFLLLTTIPIQLGKHFWPDFSFVQGIRVDYLSPTFYISDFAFLILLILSFSRIGKEFGVFLLRPLFFLTILVFSAGLFAAMHPLATLLGILKFLQFSYLAFYVCKTFRLKDYSPLTFILVLGGLVQTIILAFQFYSQRSLGGVFYYLGERTFDVSTPGIAAFRWNENFLMRPYGTFPHPNVLAFYLLLGFFFLLFSLNFKSRKTTFLKVCILFILAIGITFTFSRIVFILLLGITIAWAIKQAKGMKKNAKVRIMLITVLLLFAVIVIFSSRLGSGFARDMYLRFELLKTGALIFIKNPVFGVGLNNFFYHEILYQKQVTPILLQPIHNIFALWGVSTGIIGMILAGVFLRKLIGHVRKRFLLILVVSALVVGMFDHYLLTLQQGQLMAALIIGISFTKAKD
ncbi:MAG: O-antigen ligase family protein [Candidatus Levybacteria bacterium]|nr:O-antigen ligase family protein [Candidatus Levybacteria bacterium]